MRTCGPSLRHCTVDWQDLTLESKFGIKYAIPCPGLAKEDDVLVVKGQQELRGTSQLYDGKLWERLPNLQVLIWSAVMSWTAACGCCSSKTAAPTPAPLICIYPGTHGPS